MRLAVVSDTHGKHDDCRAAPADVLVHAGDMTLRGTLAEVQRFALWVAKQRDRYKHIVVVPGNHDTAFESIDERDQARAMLEQAGAIVLMDTFVELDGIVFHGSPFTPRFGTGFAFQLDRGRHAKQHWRSIPEHCDVLICHGPPLGHGDRIWDGSRVGCQDLYDRVREVRPAVCIFGHIHEDPGITREGETLFVNASTCDLRYQATRPSIPLALARDPDDGAAGGQKRKVRCAEGDGGGDSLPPAEVHPCGKAMALGSAPSWDGDEAGMDAAAEDEEVTS
mmetsp:Transcript_29645/g.96564  ORF Transcript_29645/g.96564 Transcript_29645/m.96564 type:complete len:280 (+) Transcript_29645:1222-2061(+)